MNASRRNFPKAASELIDSYEEGGFTAHNPPKPNVQHCEWPSYAQQCNIVFDERFMIQMEIKTQQRESQSNFYDAVQVSW